jgi:hypothetical protein
MIMFGRHNGHIDNNKLKSILKKYKIKHINTYDQSGQKIGWFLCKNQPNVFDLVENVSCEFLKYDDGFKAFI